MADANPFGSPGATQQTVFEYELPPEGEDSLFYVPPGSYVARVVGIEAKVSKSNNPMWVVKYRVVAEYLKLGDKSHGQDVSGKELSQFLVTTKQAAWKVRPAMAALGLIQPDGRTIKFVQGDVIGKGAIITVIDSDYNGKKSSSVDDVAPLPPGTTLPKPDDVPF